MSGHTPIPSGGEETPSTTPGTPFNEAVQNGSVSKLIPSSSSKSKKTTPVVAANTGFAFLPEGAYKPRYIDV